MSLINFDYHPQFFTATILEWKPLLKDDCYKDIIIQSLKFLKEEGSIVIYSFVIMPNHIHVLLYFPQMPKSLNSIISNAKRFMTYEIVKRLKQSNQEEILDILFSGVKNKEKNKGQIHKVFEESFDAKECFSEKFIYQKLSYIHLNPISKKWNLVNDFTDYEHSSASFYEKGIKNYSKIMHVGDSLDGKLSGSPSEDPERT